MFTWFTHPNQPRWFIDPTENLVDCVSGLLTMLAFRGPQSTGSWN